MPKKRPLLLTDNQRAGLLGEKKLSEPGKRQNDMVAREKLEFYLRSAKDAELILDALPQLVKRLPEEEKDRFARREYLAPLLNVVEKFLDLLDPWPIGESEEGELLSIKTFAKRSGEPGKCWVESRYMDALPEEIETWERLKEHAARLQYFIDPYLISPDAPPDGIREWFDRERHRRQFVTGTNYFARWRDEEGIGRAAPVLVDEEDVRRHKRWNPTPLPMKYEVAEDQRSVSPSSEE